MAGKTTFIRKISNDWAKKQISDKSSSSSDGDERLQTFILIIPIILRLIKKMDLIRNIAYQMDFLTEQDLQILQWFLQNHSSKVLFLYDGLDEFNDSLCPCIVSHLKGVTFPGSSVVLTSRGEGVGRLQEWRVTMHVEAELQGFGVEEIEQYVNLYFKSSTNPRADVKPLLEKILPNCHAYEYQKEENLVQEFELYAMAKNPGRLDILCLLWEQNHCFSDKREELYGDFIKVVLQLAAKRNNIQLARGDVLVASRDILLRFGELAMAREANNMVTVFTMQQVEDVVGKDGMKWGFLFKSHPVSRLRDCQVSFLHKTIQEWLAAFYVTSTENAWKEVSYSCFKELENELSFHQFILHMDTEKMEKIASAAIKNCFNNDTFDFPNESIKSLLQWQTNCGLKCETIKNICGTKFAETITRATITGGNCKSVGHLISSMSACKYWYIKNIPMEDVVTEIPEPQAQVKGIRQHLVTKASIATAFI